MAETDDTGKTPAIPTPYLLTSQASGSTGSSSTSPFLRLAATSPLTLNVPALLDLVKQIKSAAVMAPSELDPVEPTALGAVPLAAELAAETQRIHEAIDQDLKDLALAIFGSQEELERFWKDMESADFETRQQMTALIELASLGRPSDQSA